MLDKLTRSLTDDIRPMLAADASMAMTKSWRRWGASGSD